MAKLEGKHEISTIGQTRGQAFTTSSSAELTLNTSPDKTGPHMYLLRPSQDCYVRQTSASGLTATTNDMLLRQNEGFKIIVRSSSENVISVLGAIAGTLKVTELTSSTPGEGASS